MDVWYSVVWFGVVWWRAGEMKHEPLRLLCSVAYRAELVSNLVGLQPSNLYSPTHTLELDRCHVLCCAVR